MTPFQKAFKEAREAGKNTFTFKGKKYNTKTAAGNLKKALKGADAQEENILMDKINRYGTAEEKKAIASRNKHGGKIYDSKKGERKTPTSKTSGVKKAAKPPVKASGKVSAKVKADTSKKAVGQAKRAGRKATRQSRRANRKK